MSTRKLLLRTCRSGDKVGTWVQHQERARLACRLATTSSIYKSPLTADRNLAHTLLEILHETVDPKLLSLCKKIPKLTQLAPDFTATLAPCHERNHLLITLLW